MHGMSSILYKISEAILTLISGENKGPRPLLNLRLLHRNVIFAIEKHLSFNVSKVGPVLSVASSITVGIAPLSRFIVNVIFEL